jgi:hypothetical protein
MVGARVQEDTTYRAQQKEDLGDGVDMFVGGRCRGEVFGFRSSPSICLNPATRAASSHHNIP